MFFVFRYVSKFFWLITLVRKGKLVWIFLGFSLCLCVRFACKMPVEITMVNELRCVQGFVYYLKRAELSERKICETYDTDYVKNNVLGSRS